MDPVTVVHNPLRALHQATHPPSTGALGFKKFTLISTGCDSKGVAQTELRDSQGRRVDPDALNKMNFEGTIGFTCDTKGGTALHWLMWLIQKIRSWFFNYPLDPCVAHGFIASKLRAVPREDGTISIVLHIGGHSDFLGIQTSVLDLFNHPIERKGVTEVVLYVPDNSRVARKIARFLAKTVYIPKETCRKKGLVSPTTVQTPFPIRHLIWQVSSRAQGVNPRSLRALKRLAWASADVITGPICNRKGNPREFICSAYALSVLQANMVTSVLSASELDSMAKMNRSGRAQYILTQLTTKDTRLWKLWKNNPLLQMDAGYAMSAWVARELDQVST